MDILFFPLANPLWNTFIRSIVMILILVSGFKVSLYNAYWAAIVHDAISLILIRPYV